MKKFLMGASLLGLVCISFAVSNAYATNQSVLVIHTVVPRTAAPLVAAPRDDQADAKDPATEQVAVKAPDQDYVLQKAARN